MQKTDSVIALTSSNRFNEKSAAGKLKNAMQDDIAGRVRYFRSEFLAWRSLVVNAATVIN